MLTFQSACVISRCCMHGMLSRKQATGRTCMMRTGASIFGTRLMLENTSSQDGHMVHVGCITRMPAINLKTDITITAPARGSGFLDVWPGLCPKKWHRTGGNCWEEADPTPGGCAERCRRGPAPLLPGDMSAQSPPEANL